MMLPASLSSDPNCCAITYDAAAVGQARKIRATRVSIGDKPSQRATR